ncbi:MAG TPA: hypothetical protein VF039_02360 [Longimicrobiales bacterium]
MSIQFRVRGLPAVIIIVGLVVFGGWRARAARADLETGAADEIARVLRAEFARELLGDMGSGTPTAADADALLRTQNVSFTSMRARGSTGNLVVRVRVLVDGQPPADGRDVRYFRMRYSPLTGWHLRHESNAFAWHTTFF